MMRKRRKETRRRARVKRKERSNDAWSAAAPFRCAGFAGRAARVSRALLARLEDGEHPLVGGIGKLSDGVGADFVRLVARELVSFLVDEGLAGTQIDRLVSLEDAALGFLELEAANRNGEERIALDVLPVRLLQHLEAVEAR